MNTINYLEKDSVISFFIVYLGFFFQRYIIIIACMCMHMEHVKNRCKSLLYEPSNP